MLSFQGVAYLNLDAKGRLTMPARHRDVLSAQLPGPLTITLHPYEDCLLIYPRLSWEPLREELADLPTEDGATSAKRRTLGHATEVELDATGRALLPPELRDDTNITRDVVLLGVGNHFEVWDRELYKADKEKGKVAARASEAVRKLKI